jgi:hypothetical protein
MIPGGADIDALTKRRHRAKNDNNHYDIATFG